MIFSKPDDKTPKEWAEYLRIVRAPRESERGGVSHHGLGAGCSRKLVGDLWMYSTCEYKATRAYR